MLTVISPVHSFHRMYSQWYTLQTDNLEPRFLSTSMLWSDRQLAATSSVTKQTKITVGNSTDCNAKQTAGNFKLLHIDRLFSVITATWHTYQLRCDSLAAWEQNKCWILILRHLYKPYTYRALHDNKHSKTKFQKSRIRNFLSIFLPFLHSNRHFSQMEHALNFPFELNHLN